MNLEEHQSNVHGDDFCRVVFLWPKLTCERQRNLMGVSAFERCDCTHQRCTEAAGPLRCCLRLGMCRFTEAANPEYMATLMLLAMHCPFPS